jgi:hypothetical protein
MNDEITWWAERGGVKVAERAHDKYVVTAPDGTELDEIRGVKFTVVWLVGFEIGVEYARHCSVKED